MTSSPVEDFLNRFVNLERTGEFKYARNLQRMKNLMSHLGNPERSLRVRLVAGSKGKGSVSENLHGLLSLKNPSVGLYTSPHLISWNERIRIGGITASNEQLECHIEQLESAVKKMASDELPTYFELSTALAFLHFRHHGVSEAVVEVGLGGKYDATNVTEPFISVITPVSLEHQAVLGDTVLEIAEEKAGILRRSGLAVIADQELSTVRFLESKSEEIGSGRVVCSAASQIISSKPSDQGMSFGLKGEWGEIRNIQMKRYGKANLENFLTAVSVFWNDPLCEKSAFESDIRLYLNSASGLRARCDLVSAAPLILIDGSHNASSGKALADTVRSHWPSTEVHIIIGMLRDKDVNGYWREIQSLPISTIAATDIAGPRGLSAKEVKQRIQREDAREAGTVKEAMQILSDGISDRHLILVCGSMYLAGEAYSLMHECIRPGVELV